MPTLALLYDPDPDRRSEAIRRIGIEPGMHGYDVPSAQWSHGPWQFLCRTNQAMPVQMADRPDGGAFIVGHLLDRSLKSWRPEDSVVDPIGGFGAYLQVDKPSMALKATADVLGVFPLYYAYGKDWFMVTTIPWLFRCHPDFQPSWDLEGVASVLTTMHLVSGQTIWKGVRRLNAGHWLEWKPGGPARETPGHRLIYYPEKVRRTPGEIHHRMQEVIRALSGNEYPVTLLLSGGLDSRLVAGILAGMDHRRLRALTNGYDSDLEVQCARLVSNRLGIPHHIEEVSADNELAVFRMAATRELASNGMNTTNAYAVAAMLPEGKPVATGYSIDLFMNAPTHFHARMPDSLDGLVSFFGRWGMDDATCSTLRPADDFLEAIANVREHQRKIVHQFAAPSFHHAAQFYEALLRQRFHVGGMGWRLSHRAKPVMPLYDAELMEMLFALPDEMRKERRIEKDILMTFYPGLSRLPVDRNGIDTSPLLQRRWFDDLVDRLTGRPPARVKEVKGHPDLRYFRSMSINAPTWQHIREELEPLREGLCGLFDEQALHSLLPKPGVEIPMQVPIAESSCRKTLLALMIIADAMRHPFPR